MATHSPARYEELKAAVTAARLQFDAGKAAQPDNAAEVLQGVDETPVQIPSRDGGRTIVGRLYRAQSAPASASAGPAPVLVNWHGSGLVFHMFGQDRPFCAQVARDIPGLVVLDADYRKAPEDPFPAAVHDVEDALRWVAGQPAVYDASRVALSGFSAGGLLALVAGSTFRQTFAASAELRGLQIPVVVAVYPPTDLSVPAAERKQVEKPIRPIPPQMAALFDECWTPDPKTRLDPRASPGRADPALFPDHVVIVTCGGDNCAPEANDLADKLKDGKRKVVHEVMEGMPHAFDKTCQPGTPEWDQMKKMNALIIKELKEALRV
ncbi:hypothetical protein PG999_003977 [Apiospora kogelbergensis]|uniref:Alpha/beta hydrolase fold-3 domain-containing protein n=1 Tax=Apiospora kogelbergensis TaxID=1337665 RepID=A0AAW0R5A6_9PEZI